MQLRLVFPRNLIPELEARYRSQLPASEWRLEEKIEGEIAPRAKRDKYFSRDDFEVVCVWKSRERNRHRWSQNTATEIHHLTNEALTISTEARRITALTELNGVGWPTASVFLHFAHSEPYPILDIRALTSLGWDKPTYPKDFKLWWKYVETCRALASECGVSMRKLDRALWQFDNERDSKKKKSC